MVVSGKMGGILLLLLFFPFNVHCIFSKKKFLKK